MDASFFAKLVSTWTLNVQVVGITGTRGKSTVTHLIYKIIKAGGKSLSWWQRQRLGDFAVVEKN